MDRTALRRIVPKRLGQPVPAQPAMHAPWVGGHQRTSISPTSIIPLPESPPQAPPPPEKPHDNSTKVPLKHEGKEAAIAKDGGPVAQHVTAGQGDRLVQAQALVASRPEPSNFQTAEPLGHPRQNKGRKPGAQQYSQPEILQVLRLVRVKRPRRGRGWEELALAHRESCKEHGWPQTRTGKSLKKLVKRLALEQQVSRDGQLPPEVSMAKDVWGHLQENDDCVDGDDGVIEDEDCTCDGADMSPTTTATHVGTTPTTSATTPSFTPEHPRKRRKSSKDPWRVLDGMSTNDEKRMRTLTAMMRQQHEEAMRSHAQLQASLGEIIVLMKQRNDLTRLRTENEALKLRIEARKLDLGYEPSPAFR